jgi:hypothetical protein
MAVSREGLPRTRRLPHRPRRAADIPFRRRTGPTREFREAAPTMDADVDTGPRPADVTGVDRFGVRALLGWAHRVLEVAADVTGGPLRGWGGARLTGRSPRV